MEGDRDDPPDPVISQSANVVVQRMDSGYPAWNLAASVEGSGTSAESEPQVAYVSVSDLTPDQLEKLGIAEPKKRPKFKTLTEGFETNETSQFNVVDVEQEEEDEHNYLGHVLEGEFALEGEIPHQGEIPTSGEIPVVGIPHGELSSVVDSPAVGLVGEPLQKENLQVSGTVTGVSISQSTVAPPPPVETKSETTTTSSSETATTSTDENTSKSPESTARRSARQSAAALTKSEESEDSEMVRTNIGKKITVRTRGRGAKSETNGFQDFRGIVITGSGHGEGGKLAKPPQGFDASHADHSYAGRGAPAIKGDQSSTNESEPLEVAEVTNNSTDSKKEKAQLTPQEHRPTRERRSTAGKHSRLQEDAVETTTKKRSASNRKTASKKDKKPAKGKDKAGPSGVKRASADGDSSGVSDSGRPKRASGRNFKVKDLALASSDEEEGDDGGEDGGSEWSEDEDPERLWCICRKPHDSRFMICCDKCEDWFHGTCVNVTKSQGKHMEDNGLEWFCPGCKGLMTSTTKIKEPSHTPPDRKRDRSSKGNARKVKSQRRETSKGKEKTGDKRRLPKGGGPGEGREVKQEPTTKVEVTEIIVNRTTTTPRRGSNEGQRVKSEPGRLGRQASKEEEKVKVEPAVLAKQALKDDREEPAKKVVVSTVKVTVPEVKERIAEVKKKVSEVKNKVHEVKSKVPEVKHKVPEVKHKVPEHKVPEVKHKVVEVKHKSAEVKHSREVRDKDAEGATEDDVKPSSPSKSAKVTPEHKRRDSLESLRKKLAKPTLPKQKCIMTNCHATARPNTIYCSNRCILRHAVESLQLLHQEKWFSQGFKRDSTGEVKGRAHCEGDRVPVVEKHTNRLRTGLAAPTPEDLPSWLERHPTYEVLVPTTKKTPSPAVSPTPKPSKEAKEIANKRRESRERRRSESESKHTAEKSPVRQDAPPKEHKKADAEKSVERRKSSESESGRQSSQQSSAEGVRQNVKKSLAECLCNRLKGAPEMKVTPEEATKTAHVIEGELFKLHKDTGMKYKAKYRTLIFNLRDVKNKGLFRRVVQHKIKPAKLVQMSSEQLASKELAQWREREAKHSLEMIVEVEKERKEVPIIIKTHKGEVEITEEENLSTLQVNTNRDSPIPVEMKSPTPATPTSSTTVEPIAAVVVDTTDQHRSHLFDLNCKICTGRAAPPEETSAGAKKAKVKRQVSKAEELEREEAEAKKVAAKLLEKQQQKDKKMKKKGVKEVKKDGKEVKKDKVAKVKEFVARTPPGTPPRTPPVVTEKPPPKVVKSFWKGFLNMQDVAKFVAAAYHVSGPIDILNELFPDSLEIRGRIPFVTVWDYFNKLKSAGSTELTVLRFQVAHEEDSTLYGNLFKYFSSRERIGVIGFEKPLVKDFYILPVPAQNPIPPHILPFEGPGLSETREDILLGLIIIHKDKARVTAAQISPTHVQPRQQKAKQEAGKGSPVSGAAASGKRPSSEPAKPAKRVTIREPEEEEKHYLPPVVKRIKSTDPEYVPEAQMADPIVAQYGGVSEEEVEPYSPSQEEREAPYDPTDVLDDLAQKDSEQRTESGPAGVTNPAVSKISTESEAYSPSHPTESYPGENQSEGPPDVDKLNQLIQGVSGNIASLGTTEIASAANAASNVSENLLSSLGDSDLSEQQQLLIQLTRQVEEAKKALLDKQIESLQSEISRATNQMATLQNTDSIGGPPGAPFGNGEEAGVLKAPADSSTSGMTPLMDEMGHNMGMREGPGPPNFYGPPGNPGFGPNFNQGPMGPNMGPMPGPFWQGPGMPPGMGEPGGGPFPPPPGMMGPGNMGPGWGPGGYNGP